jgi:hypothetical protein
MSSDVPLHRLYRHYSELPYSLRVLYTATLLVLGLAFFFAALYLYHNYAGRAGGNPFLVSYKDVMVAYAGSEKGSRLESALRGPMSTMLPPDEANIVVTWAQEGADRGKYETDIKPLLDKRCMACHDGSNRQISSLNGYDNLKKVAEQDTGVNIFTLVRVSHIHLFGLTFIFFIMGLMYSHAYVRPVWFKCTIIALPFAAVIMDVFSWYLTKLYRPFAIVVLLSGGLFGLCFAFMWVTTMYQLWFSPPPPAVLKREGSDIYNVG